MRLSYSTVYMLKSKKRGFAHLITLFTLALLIIAIWFPLQGTAQPQSEQPDSRPTDGTMPEEEPTLIDMPDEHRILHALQLAYPHRIVEISQIDDDWLLEFTGGEQLYYAEGRFLPENLRDQWEDYDPITFYSYPRDLPEWQPPSPEDKQRYAAILERRRDRPPRRHPSLYNAIWRAYDESSAYSQVKSIYFLGLQTMVHRDLLSVLASVEAELRMQAQDDRELAIFIEQLAGIEGYSYRPVAATSSLSFHSYGAAIDVIPRSYNGTSPYWLWASQWNEKWYTMPYEERFMPPQSFVRIFEQHGFIWGGKWTLFDTIHFEYRPEILLLNNFSADADVIHQRRFDF